MKKLIAFRSRRFIACQSKPSVLNNAGVMWCAKESRMRVLMTVDEIIQTHAATLEDVFDIKLQQREKNLPQIYWIPKLHKTPYRARFTAGSSSCTMTRLSKLITDCLELVRSHCTVYCKTI